MGKISLLENSLINKIAAGEVVERPGSVVKELMENAIDAGASNITIEISEGGTSVIRITDNGSGIHCDDLKTAFLRHATSKITELNDLENVLTFGFRGEALSSICAVSQLEMITKTPEENVGSRIQIHGGQVISEQRVAATEGTTILVGNLFYNTPARRKFLKKPAVESGYVTDTIQKIAMGHPEVAIKYINNNSVILQTNGNDDLKTVIYHVYGKDVAKKLIFVDEKKDGLTLYGVIGKPEVCRANRTYQNFFINGRYIRSQLMQSAVEAAYKTKLMTGKFPFCVLKLTIEPSTVDVNVHPAKMEVRFSDEDKIYNLVYDSVFKALNNEVLIPSAEAVPTKVATEYPFVSTVKPSTYRTAPKKIVPKDSNDKTENKAVYESVRLEESVLDRRKNLAEKPLVNAEPTVDINVKPQRQNFFVNYKILGQAFHTYWIIEQGESLYLIDQHAAHERALYEELLKKLKEGGILSQKLITPEVVKLGQTEMQVYNDNAMLIKKFGFEVSDGASEDELFVKSVPYIFNKPSNVVFFLEIIDKLNGVPAQIENIYDTKLDIIATISCKAAIKANDKLSYQEARALIETVLKLENPFTCPHGRPTIIELSKYETEKMFKRKGIL